MSDQHTGEETPPHRWVPDYLVLAWFLARRSPEIRGVAEMQSPSPVGDGFLLETDDGKLYDLLTQSQVEGEPYRVWRKRSKLRKQLGGLWFLRRLLLHLRTGREDVVIRIAGKPIQGRKPWRKGHFKLLPGTQMRWPLTPGADPVIDHANDLQYAGLEAALEWCRNPREGQSPCPLDGPVKPLKLCLQISPLIPMLANEQTTFYPRIQNLWAASVCPDCLAGIDTY